MFKRLKNWIFNNPAEDHAVSSFAWFGLSYLALGAAAAFPALAPVAYGTAALAGKIGLFEGILTGAHVINNILSWGFRKIFKPKAQPAPTKTEPASSDNQLEKDNEKTHQPQNTEEKPKDATREEPQPIQEPSPVKQPVQQDMPENNPQPIQTSGIPHPGLPIEQQNSNKPQGTQMSAEQLAALIQQVRILTAQVRQMRQEVMALRAENQALKQKNRLMKRHLARRQRKNISRRKLVVHRHYILNGRMMHE